MLTGSSVKAWSHRSVRPVCSRPPAAESLTSHHCPVGTNGPIHELGTRARGTVAPRWGPGASPDNESGRRSVLEAGDLLQVILQ